MQGMCIGFLSVFRVICAGLLLANYAVAQSPAPLAPSAKPDPNSPAQIGRTRLTHSLDSIAAEFTASRAASVAAIHTRAEAQERQAMVRNQIRALLGALPERTPLNARILGSTQADGFQIKKILFDSQPDFPVPALLYLPDGPAPGGKRPAILITPGHYPESKAVDYNAAALFARNGFIVLSYDPIGQGERLQYPDPANPSVSLATRSTGEHGEASLQPMLIGDTFARYFLWDAMRGIDYLAELPEVDRHEGRRLNVCVDRATVTFAVGAGDVCDHGVSSIGVSSSVSSSAVAVSKSSPCSTPRSKHNWMELSPMSPVV